MGARVPVMGPNVRTYLFHPLAQVIGCLSVWPGLKRRVMDGSFDRGEPASALAAILLSERWILSLVLVE